MKNEMFLPVVNYNGYYQVSDSGVVKSMDRFIEDEEWKRRYVKGRILRPKDNGHGYLSVALSIRGKTTRHYIHRLVAGAFIDNPEEYPFVNHKDGNPGNNNAENLEWVSHRQNVKHGYETGLNSNKGGSHSFAVGVIDNQIGMEFSTIREWAEARKINYATGRNIIAGYNNDKRIDKELIIIMKKREYGI